MQFLTNFRVNRNLAKLDEAARNANYCGVSKFMRLLSDLGDPRGIKASLGTINNGFSKEDVKTLAAYGARGIPTFISALVTEDDTRKHFVCEVLVQIGKPSVPALIELLEAFLFQNQATFSYMKDNSNPDSAFKSLPKEYAEVLAETRRNEKNFLDSEKGNRAIFLGQIDAQTVDLAIWTLGRLRGASAEPTLEKFAKHPDKKISQQAILSLGFIGSQKRVKELISLLESPCRTENFSLIIAAASALGCTGSRDALKALEKVIPLEEDVSPGPDSPGERFVQSLFFACQASINQILAAQEKAG